MNRNLVAKSSLREGSIIGDPHTQKFLSETYEEIQKHAGSPIRWYSDGEEIGVFVCKEEDGYHGYWECVRNTCSRNSRQCLGGAFDGSDGCGIDCVGNYSDCPYRK